MANQTIKRSWTPPKYPELGGQVSAKIMNRAEIDETFAETVREAIRRHQGQRFSTYRDNGDTFLTVTVGPGTVTILADESEFFRELEQHRHEAIVARRGKILEQSLN
jgi:hypothetical protein